MSSSANSADNAQQGKSKGGRGNLARRKRGEFESLVGRKFNMLLVISHAGRYPGTRQHTWNCSCDCGAMRVAVGTRLKNGSVKSCGCYKRTQLGRRRLTHGHSAESALTPEYRTWRSIRKRCEIPSDTRYDRYGGRGIKVCDKWKRSFEAFLADVGPKPSPKHSMGRINNDGDYEPGNVRWETALEQGSNTSRTRNFTIDGRTQHLAAWIREAGLHFNTVRRRMNRGLNLKEALDMTIQVPPQ